MTKSAAAELGARGGKAAAARMTPEQRTERARRAAEARWKSVRVAKAIEVLKLRQQ